MEPPAPTSTHGRRFRVESTSRSSATVSPVILRGTDNVRLVFKPTLVDNMHDASASVNGTLCYQRKRRSDTWEDCEAIPLSSLRAGDGVRLDLHSGEVLQLFRALNALYRTVERDGIPTGVHDYIQVDRGTVLEDVAALMRNGGVRDILELFVEWAQESESILASDLMGVDSQTLLNFDAAVGAARLQKFLAEARNNLSNDEESFWQDFLERQPWIISQIYATPLVILREQAYVGGKSIDNRGGSIVDYMFRNALTENSLLVELKTPATPLLTASEYRNGVYGPSKELGGATQQMLHSRQTLQEDYLTLTRRADSGFNIFGTRALLIIGTLPSSAYEAKVRSFEIYRNAHRGLEIVTFDELLKKGELLLNALTS